MPHGILVRVYMSMMLSVADLFGVQYRLFEDAASLFSYAVKRMSQLHFATVISVRLTRQMSLGSLPSRTMSSSEHPYDHHDIAYFSNRGLI